MGILDFFRRDEVVGSRVLVCAIDPRFAELVTTDSQIYQRFYRFTKATLFSTVHELTEALGHRYDIVHLFCDVTPSGVLIDRESNKMRSTGLLEKCCLTNVKLLWIASDNPPDTYINAFNARGKRINLVMTLARNDPIFSDFLEKLLFRIFYGDTIPVAWNDLCPQAPGTLHPDAPSCILFAGRGAVRLR